MVASPEAVGGWGGSASLSFCLSLGLSCLRFSDPVSLCSWVHLSISVFLSISLFLPLFDLEYLQFDFQQDKEIINTFFFQDREERKQFICMNIAVFLQHIMNYMVLF